VSSVNATAISYTPSVIADQMVGNIRSNESLQASLEEQLSTGQTINAPSDNPAGAAGVLRLSAAISRATQYTANATDGLGWLSVGNATMNSIVTTLQGVQQSVESVSGVSLSGSASSLTALAQQITGASQQLVALGNTTYNGQAIFAGTGNVTQAYDSSGNYVGGGSAPTRTVGSGTAVPIAVTGPSVFGSGSTGLLGPAGALAQLAADITTGTPASLQAATTTDLTNLNTAISQVETQASALGTSYQQMQAFSAQASASSAAMQAQLSGSDSTDVAQVSTQLTMEQQSFQSGLWAISQLQQNSLVQYLS
jgi:flagellar hook-associated protein 3 FlgL